MECCDGIVSFEAMKMEGGGAMAEAFDTSTHERPYCGRTILVENVTPVYVEQEREAVKRSIEEQLYEVFCKYMTD